MDVNDNIDYDDIDYDIDYDVDDDINDDINDDVNDDEYPYNHIIEKEFNYE